MPTLTLTGAVAQGLADAVRTSMIETPAITAATVLALPTKSKEAIFFAMIEELIAIHNGGQGLIPLTHSDGRSFGYMVPPEAARSRHERMMADLPEAIRTDLNKPLPADFDLNNTFEFDELFSEEPERAEAA